MRKLLMGSSCLVLLACGKGEAPAPAPTATAPAAPPTKAAGHEADDHHHEAPHGGVMVAAGDYHLEAVSSKMGIVLYLSDAAEKPIPPA